MVYFKSVPFAVPAPTVNITGIDPHPIFAGTSLLLTCTIELPADVNADQVTLNSIWRRGGDVLSSSTHITITAINTISPYLYRTTLSISPLSNTEDSGQYSCHSLVTSTAYVLHTDASHRVLVRVEGIDQLCTNLHHYCYYPFSLDLPVPVIVINSEGNRIVGENFTLSCTVKVIEGLTDDATIVSSWTNVGGETMQSTTSQTSALDMVTTLEFEPLLSSHGGRYFCVASINISSISTLKTNSESLDVTVQCM